jgi:acyl-coenzyme A thioesterase PaaI-like protein
LRRVPDRYRDQLPIGVPVRLEGRLQRRKGRLAVLQGAVIRQDTEATVAEATGHFMLG